MGSPGIKEIHEAKIDIYGRARREGYGVLGLHVIDGRKIAKHISQIDCKGKQKSMDELPCTRTAGRRCLLGLKHMASLLASLIRICVLS
jgi:hypothetical protein